MPLVDDLREQGVKEASDAGNDIVYAFATFVLPANVEALVLLGAADVNGTGGGGNDPMLAALRERRLFKRAFEAPAAALPADALEWIADGKAGDGFTDVGRKRASDLARGASVSMETLKRMKAYFDRHQSDKDATGFNSGEEGFPSAGRVAWDAWGGDAGYSWAKSKASTEDKSVEAERQAFAKFLRGRIKKGSWRDFTFVELSTHEAEMLNAEGRAKVTQVQTEERWKAL